MIRRARRPQLYGRCSENGIIWMTVRGARKQAGVSEVRLQIAEVMSSGQPDKRIP